VCPECGSHAFDEAVQCRGCGEWVPRSEAWGFGSRLRCKSCVSERSEDIDFLVSATGDTEDVEIPMLYRYIFSDDDIEAILYRAAKEKLARGDFDASDYIDDYANDIAEAMEKEE
jgi:predicted amidophosphoribosyltransferase